ncbi:murein hydrolase activator EnvC family protein [Ponticaulis profundi]|uniref:Murein hydrolase activator EnvC family protein n=1 Tax=Ponticaulis profundi TaxID=2665222 RepID=A0ABW1SD90_9PROT
MSLLKRSFLSVALVTLAYSGVHTAIPQESVSLDDLREVEAQLERDRKALEAIEAAQNSARADMTVVNRQLISAAQESLRREEQASEIERRLIELEIKENDARNQLMADRQGLKDIMTALIQASRKKPPALATHPDRATNAIQAAIVMRDMADQLEIRSEKLAENVRSYADLLEKTRKEKDRLDTAEKLLSAKKDEIERLAAIKRSAFEDISGEAEKLKKRLDAVAVKAENIRSLLADLEANAPTPPSRKPSVLNEPAPKGADEAISVAVLSKLGLPAAGQVIQTYGDELPSGRKAEGLTVRTRSSAQVVAPADSVIVWSGPFRSYGQMLILRTGDGYHIVLSGLADIYGTRGQSVLAGEPVGAMSNRDDIPQELYMELRKDGLPEDPAKWMSRSKG